MKAKKQIQTNPFLRNPWGEPVKQDVPNERIRIYHTRGKMSRSGILCLTLGEKSSSRRSDLKAAGPVAKEIVRRLFAIPGVTRLAFRAYSVDVSIGQAFAWEELEPMILGVLKTAPLE